MGRGGKREREREREREGEGERRGEEEREREGVGEGMLTKGSRSMQQNQCRSRGVQIAASISACPPFDPVSNPGRKELLQLTTNNQFVKF